MSTPGSSIIMRCLRLLEDIDGWKSALAGGLILQPCASVSRLKRPLKMEERFNRIGKVDIMIAPF